MDTSLSSDFSGSFVPTAPSLFPGVPSNVPQPTPNFGMDIEIPSSPDINFPEVPEMPSFVHTNSSVRPTAPPPQSAWQQDLEEFKNKEKQQQQQQFSQHQQQLLLEQQRLQEQIRALEQQRLQEQQRALEQQRLQELEMRKQQLQQQQLMQQLQEQQQRQSQAQVQSQIQPKNGNANVLRSSVGSGGSNGVPSSSTLNAAARQILQQQEWRPTYQPGDFVPDEDAIIDATQHAKYVLSALQFDDVPTAIKYLCYCLKKLTGDDNLFSQ